jgi:cytoskeletal protein CcmA (bactofilin family)
MFKKVIGQDQGEAARSTTTSAPDARPTDSAMPAAQSAYSASGSSYSSQTAAPRSTSPQATRNVLSSDVEIKGSVKFTNDLVIDGKIEGNISSEGNLTIGENARIKAEISTATIIVYGKVHGNLTATERVELKASAEVVGDIKAKTLSIEAGAIFVGKSTVGTPAQGTVQAAPAASSSAAKPAPSPTDLPKQGTLAGTIS